MITIDEARKRVAVGAAHLDTARPGWHDRIDVGTLTLHDPCGCIVGQLTGNSQFNVTLIGLTPACFIGRSDAIRCGMELELYEREWARFAIAYTELRGPRPTREQCFQPLQDAWIEAIADRRVCSQETIVLDHEMVGRIR